MGLREKIAEIRQKLDDRDLDSIAGWRRNLNDSSPGIAFSQTRPGVVIEGAWRYVTGGAKKKVPIDEHYSNKSPLYKVEEMDDGDVMTPLTFKQAYNNVKPLKG